MKKLFLVIFSFLFIGCATIGGGLLLSACGSSQTISGGGFQEEQNENLQESDEDIEENATTCTVTLKFPGKSYLYGYYGGHYGNYGYHCICRAICNKQFRSRPRL